VFGSIRISTIPILLAQKALLRLPRRTGTDHPLIFHGSRLKHNGGSMGQGLTGIAAFATRAEVQGALLDSAKEFGWRGGTPTTEGVSVSMALQRARFRVDEEDDLCRIWVDGTLSEAQRYGNQIASSAVEQINLATARRWAGAKLAISERPGPATVTSLGGPAASKLDRKFPSGTTCLAVVEPDGILIGTTHHQVVLHAKKLVAISEHEETTRRQASVVSTRLGRALANRMTPYTRSFTTIETATSGLTLVGQRLGVKVLAARISSANGHEPAGARDIAGQLRQLHELHAQGVLSDEDFDRAKAQVLGGG
jgi:hypothetical protein